jgi:hypothetical protein
VFAPAYSTILNDPARPGLNQHHAVVHDSVAVLADTILGRDFIVLHARCGQHRADLDFILVSIRWRRLAHDILPEAGALFDAKEASDTAGNSTKHAADNSTHRSGCRSTLFRAALSASDNALCLSPDWQCENRHQRGRNHRFHGLSFALFCGEVGAKRLPRPAVPNPVDRQT